MRRKLVIVVTAALLIGLLSPTGIQSEANAKKITGIAECESESAIHKEMPVEDSIQEKKGHPASGYQTPAEPKRIRAVTGNNQNCGDNAFWSLNNGVLTISGSGAMADYNADAPWYDQADSITSIVIEEGITSIGECAFYECRKAEQVSIPSTVSAISRCAFAECSSLTEVILPDSVTVLTYGSFANCEALTDIRFDGVTKLEDYAFQGVSMECLTIPAGLSDKKDISFTIPDNVTKIGMFAMSYTENLNEVKFGSSVNTLDESAFCLRAMGAL